MDKNEAGGSRAYYTVKQLSALFGKSEDSIRRWKNEGIGRGEDNIRLRSLEREDGAGRKNTRHLVFSREAVIEFVRANPFLMDSAPELAKLMEAEDAWRGRAIPMPGPVDGDPGDEGGGGLAIAAAAHGGDSPGWSGFIGEHRFHRSIAFEEPEWEDETEDEAELFENFARARERLRNRAGFDVEEEPEPDLRFRSRGRDVKERAKAEQDYKHRMKVIGFALDTLRERCCAFDKERSELEKAMEELQESSLSTAASVAQVLSAKCSELREQKDMLLEFIAVIEEEIKED